MFTEHSNSTTHISKEISLCRPMNTDESNGMFWEHEDPGASRGRQHDSSSTHREVDSQIQENIQEGRQGCHVNTYNV